MNSSLHKIHKATRTASAFTLIELLAVVACVMVLVAMLLPAFSRPKHRDSHFHCIPNLKEIGTAYRLWADDNCGHYPAETAITNGGWRDVLTSADQGALCWTNYVIIANELGQSPKLIVCPEDERTAATDNITNIHDNMHISYFVGITANDRFPQSIVAGDRNLGDGANAGRDYGFSPANGKGNDIALPLIKSVSWTLKMHSRGNPQGEGCLLFGDGSAQTASSASFRTIWLANAAPTTDWPAGHAPASPSIRLVFP